MSVTSNELSSSYQGVTGAHRHWMRRGEFFAGLYILGCVNGHAGFLIQGVDDGNNWWGAVQSVSAIVVLSCLAGVWLMLEDKTDEPIRPLDYVGAAVFLFFVTLSVGAMNWIAITALSLYILLFLKGPSSRQRGATTLLAVTVPMLWSKLLFAFLSKYFLIFDSSLVAWVLGTERTGNMIRFADGSGQLVVFPNCSSVANVSLAFLCWVAATQAVNHRRSRWDMLWCLLACASVVVVNITRISIEGMSYQNYVTFHNPRGDLIFNTAILIATLGFTALGVRRELFSRT